MAATFESSKDLLLLRRSADLRMLQRVGQLAAVEVAAMVSKLRLSSGDWSQQLLAGSVAGAVSRTCTAPVDRLKVMLQAHGSQKNLGVLSGFRYMLHEGGVASLWRGNGINVVKIMPEAALKFALYDQIKRRMRGNSKRDLAVWERFVAGSLAGALAQTTIYPLDVLKTRLALATTGQYRGALDCAVHVCKLQGLRALFRGYLPNVLGILPYAGIDLTIYESLKGLYLSRTGEVNVSVPVLLGCGTVSSTCGQLVSYPLMLVRTKLQAGVSHGKATSMVAVFKAVVKNEGVRGLYRGIVPNFMKVAPAVSISYVVYEKMSQALGIKMS